MAFSSPFTAVTGAVFTAAQWNTYGRDNLNAIWVGSAAGDIDYYSSASAKTRIAKPSVDSVLKNTSLGAPAWLAMTALPGRIHTIGDVSDASTRTTNSTTLTDVVGVTLNLTLTETCTIVALAFGQSFTNAGLYYPTFAINIDGTDDPNAKFTSRDAAVRPTFFTFYMRTGILAGTRNVKLRFKIQNASDDAFCTGGRLLALAIKE